MPGKSMHSTSLTPHWPKPDQWPISLVVSAQKYIIFTEARNRKIQGKKKKTSMRSNITTNFKEGQKVVLPEKIDDPSDIKIKRSDFHSSLNRFSNILQRHR